jgi:hypothetical protein
MMKSRMRLSRRAFSSLPLAVTTHNVLLVYLSTTTVFRQTHVTIVDELSRQLSGMTVRRAISLAITAHELALSFALSPLDARVLINVGGIDIYYLKPRRREKKNG